MKNKIKSFFKWLFIIFIGGIIILLISIYISSLNSYKESDFNIPKDFFNTKYFDEDEKSEENGFNDLVDFIEGLDKNKSVLSYFDLKSRCVFEKKGCDTFDKYFFENYNRELIREIRKTEFKDINIIKKYIYGSDEIVDKRINIFLERKKLGKIEEIISEEENIKNKENIIKSNLRKFKIVNFLSNKKIEKINKKEFIKQTSEYLGVDLKNLNYSSMISYFRANRFLAYDYFKKGKYDLGIDLLLKNQKFIDNLMNKGDLELMGILVGFSIDRYNIETFEYFIDNYDLSNELKEKIKIALEYKINNGLIENGLKWEYKNYFKSIPVSYSEFYLSNILYNKIIGFLFYSNKEVKVLTKKRFYDVINKKTNLNIELNINNYLGRKLIFRNIMPVYKSQFQKEEDLVLLRQSVLEKLK